MYFLSAQTFADTTPYEDGYRWQRKFAIDYTPVWNYEVDGVQVDLTLKEYNLLYLMVTNQGQVFTRKQLMDKVWGDSFVGESRTIDMHIKTLRQVYARLTDEEVASLTDAAKIFVLKGKPVHMVTGDSSNMKITTPYDLKMANALLKSDML